MRRVTSTRRNSVSAKKKKTPPAPAPTFFQLQNKIFTSEGCVYNSHLTSRLWSLLYSAVSTAPPARKHIHTHTHIRASARKKMK